LKLSEEVNVLPAAEFTWLDSYFFARSSSGLRLSKDFECTILRKCLSSLLAAAASDSVCIDSEGEVVVSCSGDDIWTGLSSQSSSSMSMLITCSSVLFSSQSDFSDLSSAITDDPCVAASASAPSASEVSSGFDSICSSGLLTFTVTLVEVSSSSAFSKSSRRCASISRSVMTISPLSLCSSAVMLESAKVDIKGPKA